MSIMVPFPDPMDPKARFDVSGATHIGLKRRSNADQYLIGRIRRVMDVVDASPGIPRETLAAGPAGHLLVVADGVGSSTAGDQASALAISTMINYIAAAMQFSRTSVSLEQDLLREFNEAICRAHGELKKVARESPELKGAATTLTMAYILGMRAYIGHVGDSRCYLVRGTIAQPITKDQTYAQMLIDEGVLTKTKAEGSRLHHVLASAVGGEDDPEVLTYMLSLDKNDGIVLCTDGVFKHLSDADIGRHVGTKSTRDAATVLVDDALKRGGSDNITVIVGRFV